MFDTSTIAIISTVFTFVATLAGTFIAWNKANYDDKAQFRSDLFKMNEKLQVQLTALQQRVDELDTDREMCARSLGELETRLERIRAALFSVLGLDLDNVLEKYNEKIRVLKVVPHGHTR